MALLCFLISFLLCRTDSFVTTTHGTRSDRVRHPQEESTTSAILPLFYKILGAPQEGSDKPTVLEEGNNKVVTGNLNGSFRQRMEDKYGVEQQLLSAASTQLEEKKAAATAMKNSDYNNYQYGNNYNNAVGTPPSPQQQATQIHVEPMRHWGGALELVMQPCRSGESGTIPSAASSVLTDFITNPDTASNIFPWVDQVVVELGAGIGTCSIAAAVLGAAVVATDASPVALQLLQQNSAKYAEHYAYGMRVETFVWGDMDQAAAVCQGQYPGIVLAADLLYPGIGTEVDLQNLKNTLEMISGPETWVVWAHEWRNSQTEQQILQGLFEVFEGPYEMDTSTVPTDKPVSIYMYRKR